MSSVVEAPEKPMSRPERPDRVLQELYHASQYP